MADQDGFARRWSRRKQTVRAQATEQPEPAEVDAPADAEPGKPLDEAEIVANLPDIDGMVESSDFTVFLREGVPETLRRKALRKLWRLNPIFANLDGLNDYDEDFTDAATAVQAVKTIYKVGRGMISDDEEDAETAAADAPAEGPEAEPDAPGPGDPADQAADSPVEIVADDAVAPAPPSDPPQAKTAKAGVEPDSVGSAPRAEKGSAKARRWGGFSS